MGALIHLERPARAEPRGLLVLHHGRGADERDLLALADVLDPKGRLHVVTPRAPLQVEGWPGYHWYLVPRAGYPDPDTFAAAIAALSEFHDSLWERTGVPPERTVLGGFSMGAVMSYALGLHPQRPAPAGVLALSGFMPQVGDWQPDLERPQTRVMIEHGRGDNVIPVEFARAAYELLQRSRSPVRYREFDGGHHIEPRGLPDIAAWIADTIAARAEQPADV